MELPPKVKWAIIEFGSQLLKFYQDFRLRKCHNYPLVVRLIYSQVPLKVRESFRVKLFDTIHHELRPEERGSHGMPNFEVSLRLIAKCLLVSCIMGLSLWKGVGLSLWLVVNKGSNSKWLSERDLKKVCDHSSGDGRKPREAVICLAFALVSLL